jgi:hypothetical protein
MKKLLGTLALAGAVAVCGIAAKDAAATPSTLIWSPSTDTQAYGVVHLTSDIYIPVKNDASGARPGTITNVGLTVGVLPLEKVGLEVGFDHIEGDNPLYLNAKLGMPEGAYGDYFPALAVGGFGIGTEADVTDYNVFYARAAKTIGPIGRLSAGYYMGNDTLLVDELGEAAESGVMVGWERTMSEISENLWVSVDYMGGESNLGVLSYGLAWKFAPNTGVIFGYVDQSNEDLAPGDTFTVQVDIDANVFGK